MRHCSRSACRAVAGLLRVAAGDWQVAGSCAQDETDVGWQAAADALIWCHPHVQAQGLLPGVAASACRVSMLTYKLSNTASSQTVACLQWQPDCC